MADEYHTSIPSPPPAQPVGALPFTGVDVAIIVIIAIGIVLWGFLISFFVRG